MMADAPVLIMAGGTGGHVFPALAVASVLRERDVPVVWLGTRRGLEARVVPAAGIPMEWLDVTGLRGKGWLDRLLAPARLLLAGYQALRVLRRVRPRTVLGMGGFVSGPGGLVARLLGRPLVIHEQNSVAGLTNRLLAPLAARVLTAFPDCFPGRCVQQVGNPVRAEIAALPPPERRMADHAGPMRLLVLGGSLGALALNETVPEALARIPAERRPKVWHQAGERTLEQARDAYARAGVEVELTAFIDDMAGAYAWADLVICRAGALTVAELTAAGLPSLLVPYPHAVDDHQTGNARYLHEAGAALLIPQSDLEAESLAARLLELSDDRPRLAAMAARARALALPEAARDVAEACLAVALKEGER
jgi:UDP-N-acetylglucosamine--N-acetylmuramyl-(pentapeptide) pyrophosphoryl-undecaprenol N-acetylglucosamine transferase